MIKYAFRATCHALTHDHQTRRFAILNHHIKPHSFIIDTLFLNQKSLNRTLKLYA